MTQEFVEQRDGGYFLAGTRVSLDSVVYAFLRGESPEGIVEFFPVLTLAQIVGALTFYLVRFAFESNLLAGHFVRGSVQRQSQEGSDWS